MGRAIIIKMLAICVIIFIALIDLGLNIVSLIPGVGDIAATGGEIFLEAIQMISAAVVAFTGEKKNGKMTKLYALCAFGFLGLIDIGINIISFIPGIGDLVETIGEAVLEIIQVAIVAILAFI